MKHLVDLWCYLTNEDDFFVEGVAGGAAQLHRHHRGAQALQHHTLPQGPGHW
jgi:hypothetical protein